MKWNIIDEHLQIWRRRRMTRQLWLWRWWLWCWKT